MNKNKIWENLLSTFPFDNYIKEERKEAYFEIPIAINKLLSHDAKILDFGAGPCDKTAILPQLGYTVHAYDDLLDDWYNIDNNRLKIIHFAEKVGIKYFFPDGTNKNFPSDQDYDAIILNNVIEHLHDSPRKLLNTLINLLKPKGVLLIAVPNAANLRKRIDIVFGRSNYPSFSSFYWSPKHWRGHIREYVKNDLLLLTEFLGFELLELKTIHYHLDTLNNINKKIFVCLCKVFPGFRESWLLIAKKPQIWIEKEKPTANQFSQAYGKQYYKPRLEDLDWE